MGLFIRYWGKKESKRMRSLMVMVLLFSSGVLGATRCAKGSCGDNPYVYNDTCPWFGHPSLDAVDCPNADTCMDMYGGRYNASAGKVSQCFCRGEFCNTASSKNLPTFFTFFFVIFVSVIAA